MALADYYLCDHCGCKTFYDANLPYGVNSEHFGKAEGEMLHNPLTQHPWPDGYIGYMVVLCFQCAETNQDAVEVFNNAVAKEEG